MLSPRALAGAAAGETEVGDQRGGAASGEDELHAGRNPDRGRNEALDEARADEHRDRAEEEEDGVAAPLEEGVSSGPLTGHEEGAADHQARAARNEDGGEFDDAVGQDQRPEGDRRVRAGERRSEHAEEQAV